MPLNIHANAKAAMIGALEERLPAVLVENASFVADVTAFIAAYYANEALPSTGQLSERMTDLIDEMPFVRFFIDQLQCELRSQYDYQPEPASQALPTIAEYADLSATATRFVEMFNTLPWSYTLTIDLPETLFPAGLVGDGAFALGDYGRLSKPDLVFLESFPLTHTNQRVQNRISGRGAGLLALGGPVAPQWDATSSYFQYASEGFVGLYGSGSLYWKAEHCLESFLGLCLSNRVLTHEIDFKKPEPTLRWTIHKEVGANKEVYTRYDANNDISGVVRYLTSFKFAQDYDVEKRGPWLRSSLEKIDRIFRNSSSSTVLLSAKWFFDSFKGSDDLLQYIRMMTCLEILLGEHANTSKASLGEILGNRLAYLIGKSHKERAEVLADFKKIYAVRSGILHHGKHKLKAADRTLVGKLRNYCKRAIERESELLLA